MKRIKNPLLHSKSLDMVEHMALPLSLIEASYVVK